MENKDLNKNGTADAVKLKGSLVAVLKKADGSVEVRRKDNMILNGGFDFIADAIGKSASRPNAMSYIAIGTGTTAAAASQTALVMESTRKATTYQHSTGTKVFEISAEFQAGEGTGAITEAGVCNAASDGTFLDRVTFAVINKGADDGLTIKFQFTLS